MSTHQLRSFSRLSLTTPKAVKFIPSSFHHPSTFTRTTHALTATEAPPRHSQLAHPITPTSLLPKLPRRSMASGPASPGVGPIHARLISDPSFYENADTEAKVAIEKSTAEEKLQMYFSSGGRVVVHKGPLPSAFMGEEVPREHTALWHVVDKRDMLYIVYGYAYPGAEQENSVMLGLMQVLEDEIKGAGRGGLLSDEKIFAIAQAGRKISFYEYRKGGSRGV